ncbi:hypothetical protein [Rhizohabitans arisaemae]|nr:hypothetical protein [Rhizohabitans arisaemae]
MRSARLTRVVRYGLIEHAFHPAFPPERHAEQVPSWLGNLSAVPQQKI